MKLEVPSSSGKKKPKDLRVSADFQLGPRTAEWGRLMDRLMSPVLQGKDQDFVGTADGYDCSDLLDGDKEPAQE